MKLNTLSCTQFAGARDSTVDFTDGINIICGNNESGKTTLVHLLSRTLFQNARLDNRSDKDFRARFFPAPHRNGCNAGDFADGKVTFEAEGKQFTLSKEWGPDPRCTLSAPEGILRDPTAIEERLRQILCYGEGVYGQLLFASRRGADAALRELVDTAAKSSTRQELIQALSRAFSHTDGLSLDAVETAIEKKISQIVGKHWDVDLCQPVRKAGRWVNGLGTILRAWYALEDAQSLEQELTALEQDVADTAAAYHRANEQAAAAEAAAAGFRTYATRLTVRAEREKNLSRLETELSRLTDILERWPQTQAELTLARSLREEQIRLQQREKYDTAVSQAAEMARLEEQLQKGPSEEDAEQARIAAREIQKLENKLGAMNLRAALSMMNGHCAEIRSLRTGEPLELSGGTASITEAVTVSIPGVMELHLTPGDVDAAAAEQQLNTQRQRLAGVLNAFDAGSPDALDAMVQKEATRRHQLAQAQLRLEQVLSGEDLTTLAAQIQADDTAVRDRETLRREILALCGHNDPDRFITARETILDSYAAQYGTPEAVKALAFDLMRERDKVRQTLGEGGDIPELYINIADPEAHMDTLDTELQEARQRRELALQARTAAVERLEARRESLTEDPSELRTEATRYFDEQQSLLDHWLHIRQVFLAQKEAIDSSPADDLADSFSRYLQLLSGGSVSPEFRQTDRLDLQLYSKDRLVDFSRLSEGTKATVLLAFRLAVLDRLFPNGGVMILDDPFADMDMNRTEKACALVRECAKRHQIIVMTCRQEYLPLLGGNVIQL